METNVAKDFISLVENCELARYAPGSKGSIHADYERASRIMATIDRQLWRQEQILFVKKRNSFI